MQLIEPPISVDAAMTTSLPVEEQATSILCVDDDQLILAALQRTLRGESYILRTARSGQEALKMMAHYKFQVIITDIGMPGMNGLSLLEKASRQHPDTIRMVLSGQSNTGTIIDAIKAGRIYQYVLKPWQDDDLKIAIRQALSLWYLQAEKTRMMQLLDQQNKQLEIRVARRTQQVLAFERQAEIGRQAAQVVHNLNNPLHALTGAIDLLSMYMNNGASDLSKMERGLSLARDAASELTTIIAGILSYARQEVRSAQKPMDVNQLIKDQLKFFEIMPGFKHQVETTLQLEPGIPRVLGNPIEIKQILSNLIKNALDAMENKQLKHLTIKTHAEGGAAVFTISDTGEGIPERHYDRIFLPDFTTKQDNRGTGLGLASVWTMIDAYSGKIEFESTEGEGTTFYVRLPGIKPQNTSGEQAGKKKESPNDTTCRSHR